MFQAEQKRAQLLLPYCLGQPHQNASVGPAVDQGHEASGIWSLRELMKQQALEREGPGHPFLQNAYEQREWVGEWPRRKV